MLGKDGKDRIDRALERHQRHALKEEATNPHCDFHTQQLFPERKFDHPLDDGLRVKACIALDVVRMGERKGDKFITDQGEVFRIEQVTKWIVK